MDALFQYLDSLQPLSNELKAALVGRLSLETYRKNRPLLHIGDTGNWLGYIEKGFVKLCYDTCAGQERIISFLRSGDIACSISSYHHTSPSRIAIVALEDTAIIKIYRRDAEAIAEKHPLFHLHLRKITEGLLMQSEIHFLLMAESAKERLARLPKLCGWMLKDRRIKQYMIAEYLGVDQATLSRWMRK